MGDLGDLVEFKLATLGPPPGSTGDPYLDLVELRILRLLSEHMDFGHQMKLLFCRGLSMARSDYLACHPDLDGGRLDSDQYLSVLIIALKRMDLRQRAKLRHPARSRDEAQLLMTGRRI